MAIARLPRSAAILVALLTFALPAAASAGNPTIERHPVYAGANAYFGDCPEEVGPIGTFCTETYLIVWHGYDLAGGGSVAPSKAPWIGAAETYRVDFDGTQDPPLTVLRTGGREIAPGQVSVDRVHLQVASAAFSVTMDDGSPFDFSGSWTAETGRFHYGNDGPAINLPHHYTDRCLTFNAQAHQNFTEGQMTGVLNGQPVASYPLTAAIFNNNFTFITVPHGGCA